MSTIGDQLVAKGIETLDDVRRKAADAAERKLRKQAQADAAADEAIDSALRSVDALVSSADMLAQQAELEEQKFKRLYGQIEACRDKIRAIHGNDKLQKILRGPPGEARERVQGALDRLHALKDQLLGVKNADPQYALVRELFAASSWKEFVGGCRHAKELGFLQRVTGEQADLLVERGFAHLIVAGGRDQENGGVEIYFPVKHTDHKHRSVVTALLVLKSRAQRNRRTEGTEMQKLLRKLPRDGDLALAFDPRFQIAKPVEVALFVRDLQFPNRSSGRMQSWAGVVHLRVTPNGAEKTFEVVKAIGPLASIFPQAKVFNPWPVKELQGEHELPLWREGSTAMPTALLAALFSQGFRENQCGLPACSRYLGVKSRPSSRKRNDRQEARQPDVASGASDTEPGSSASSAQDAVEGSPKTEAAPPEPKKKEKRAPSPRKKPKTEATPPTV
ncbi:MAG: hypothetical protein Q7T01_03485 [bacterium]|nr:hypothetical protein [bacterium]